MSGIVHLSREDFLDEMRIAPKWDIIKYLPEGIFDLIVVYSFATWVYRSPSITSMAESEGKYFCTTLNEILKTPSIAEARIR